MKVQIRRGIFETNSSSTHSLTIGSNPKTELANLLNGVICFGTKTYKDVEDKFKYIFKINGKAASTEDIQLRADLFYRVLTESEWQSSNLTVPTYLAMKDKITKALKTIGVEAVFNEDIEMFKDSYVEDGDFELFYDIATIKNQDEFNKVFLNYLFGDVLYYVFCDEGVSWERYDEIANSIESNMKRFVENKSYHNHIR